MLSLLKKFLGLGADVSTSSQEDVGGWQRFAKENADILAGWKFSATLQVRTPKKYLQMHGQLVASEADALKPREEWQGIWVPSVKEQYALKIANQQSATDIGSLPVGEYLPFLLKLRGLVETEQSINDRIESLKACNWTEQERSYIASHGGIDALAEKFFPPSLGEIGFTTAQIAQLHERGIYTPAQVSQMSDQDILSVKGVGAARLRKVREMIMPLSAYDHSRIDSVFLD